MIGFGHAGALFLLLTLCLSVGADASVWFLDSRSHSGEQLVTTARNFDPIQINGPYVIDDFGLNERGISGISGGTCPRSFEFRYNGREGRLNTGQSVIVVEHVNIAVSGIPCSGIGVVGFLDSRFIPVFDETFRGQLNRQTRFLYGVNNRDVVCGGYSLQNATILYLVYDEDPLTFTITPQGFRLPAKTKMLFVFGQDRLLECAYRGVSRLIEPSAWNTTSNMGVSPPSVPASASPASNPIQVSLPSPTNSPTPSPQSSVSPTQSPGSGAMESPSVSSSPGIPSPTVAGETGNGTTLGETSAAIGAVECFPANALVELKSGQFIRMQDLQIGATVRVSADSFSEVFFFTHRDASHRGHFVKIVAEGGRSLVVSTGHYVYANGKLLEAAKVRSGDMLLSVNGVTGEEARVVSVQKIEARGLYNPHTLDGDIVVNGVVTSTYTTAVHPTLANVLLTPVKVIYLLGSVIDQMYNRVAVLGARWLHYASDGPTSWDL